VGAIEKCNVIEPSYSCNTAELAIRLAFPALEKEHRRNISGDVSFGVGRSVSRPKAAAMRHRRKNADPEDFRLPGRLLSEEADAERMRDD